MLKYHHLGLLFLLFGISFCALGQDTTIYRGIIADRLLYETIKLYPNGTFKWTSEYDLSWTEFGLYNYDNGYLTLDYYLEWNQPETMSLMDTIRYIDKPLKTEIFVVEENGLYRLDKNGEKIIRRQDKSIKLPWSWISGYRHRYEIIEE